MKTYAGVVAVLVALSAAPAWAEGEGNNLAAAEISGSTGIYLTTTYAVQTAQVVRSAPVAAQEVAMAPAPQRRGVTRR